MSPQLNQADDLRLTHALRTGGPGALSAVYDAYGALLYDYAHALLRDERWAAGALSDALLTAYERSASLPDPERFRSWLYTLVRDECLDRLGDPERRPAFRQEAPEADLGDDPVRLGQRRMVVQEAMGGLGGRGREIADLTLRHGLSGPELAAVLGLPAREAADEAVRAHGEIAGALTELLGRPVSGDQLPAALSVLPYARTPETLRERVMTAAGDVRPGHSAVHRDGSGSWSDSGSGTGVFVGLTRSSGSGGPSGPSGPGDEPEEPGRGKVWPAVAAAGAIVLIVALVYLAMPHSSGKQDAAGTPSATASPGESVTISPGTSDGPSASPDPTTASSTPRPTTVKTTAPLAAAPPATRVTTPKRTPTKAATKAAGSVSVSSSGCDSMDASTGPATCTVTVTAAASGSVTWTASLSNPQPTGATAALSSSGGTLAAGKSATITVTITPSTSGVTCNKAGGGGFDTVTVSPASSGGVSVDYIC